ncbi:hypothetical protein [Sphaerisporangium corydalis]|uniref:Uncharacterized protein n=1 Tax=Sphaerisporangium corydalis TaxID=1441875 RepID=A0ABV9EBP5_9ACTN|nr:hypothetical protein [Sphaerisporangium corydalis]
MGGSRRSGDQGRRLSLAELRAQVHQEVATSGDRAFDSPPHGDRRPPRMVTEVEMHGVSPTDHGARSPLGVGTSTSARAEKIARRSEEEGRRKHGTEGPSGRPYGTSTPEHYTGVGSGSATGEEGPRPS